MSEILNQDQTLNYILEIINSKKSASFIRKSDGENIVLSYGSLEYRIDNKGHIMQIFFYCLALIQLYEKISFLKRCV